MAHRALALKYRPQTFADMIGQEHVTAVLTRALEGGRVAHAYLFTGARGVGKTTCARLIAKALNCQQRGLDGRSAAEPCNECTSCREITTGRGARRGRDRRRLEPRHRRRAGAAREGPLLADRRQAPRGDHRRGPPALGRRLRRAPEDARGAAAAPGVRLRHDRPAEAARDDPLAHAALRLRARAAAQGRRPAARAAAARGRGPGGHPLRADRGRGPAARAQERGLDARRGERARPGGLGGRGGGERRAGAARAGHRRPRGVLHHRGRGRSSATRRRRCGRCTRRSRRAWTRATWPRG